MKRDGWTLSFPPPPPQEEPILAAATPQPPLLRWQPETLVPLPFDAWVGCGCWESAEVEP